MKVIFFLISLALHGLILITPISHMEKSRGHFFPVTLVLQTITPEAQTSSAARSSRNRADNSVIKHLKRSRIEEVKTPGNAQLKIAAHEKKPFKHEAFVSPAGKIVDHQLKTAHLRRTPLNVSQPLSIAPVNEPQPHAKEVGEENETIVEGRFSDRDSEKPTAPEQVFLRANYSYAPKPEYPEQARREGWEGTVLLAILVDAEGRPETVVLSRSSGFVPLDTAAQETVKHWRFQPARYGSHRVQSWVKVPIVFALAEAEN